MQRDVNSHFFAFVKSTDKIAMVVNLYHIEISDHQCMEDGGTKHHRTPAT